MFRASIQWGTYSTPSTGDALPLAWGGRVETRIWRREGWGSVRWWGELQAAPRCIPSAHVQLKRLMKRESAVDPAYFQENHALSVILFLFLTFYLFRCPSLRIFMWRQERRFSFWPQSGSECGKRITNKNVQYFIIQIMKHTARCHWILDRLCSSLS